MSWVDSQSWCLWWTVGRDVFGGHWVVMFFGGQRLLWWKGSRYVFGRRSVVMCLVKSRSVMSLVDKQSWCVWLIVNRDGESVVMLLVDSDVCGEESDVTSLVDSQSWCFWWIISRGGQSVIMFLVDNQSWWTVSRDVFGRESAVMSLVDSQSWCLWWRVGRDVFDG